MNNIETMKLALEALETMQNAIYNIGGEHVTDLGYAVEKADVAEQAITSLRQAIEQAQQAEPDRGVYWKCVRCQYAHIEDECPHCGFNTRAEFKFSPPRQPEQDGVAMADYMALMEKYVALKVAQPKQKPVACGYDETTGNCTNNQCCYTSLPPRKPLTDEEIKTIFKSNVKHDITDAFSFARAIEAAVLEKQK